MSVRINDAVIEVQSRWSTLRLEDGRTEISIDVGKIAELPALVACEVFEIVTHGWVLTCNGAGLRVLRWHMDTPTVDNRETAVTLSSAEHWQGRKNVLLLLPDADYSKSEGLSIRRRDAGNEFMDAAEVAAPSGVVLSVGVVGSTEGIVMLCFASRPGESEQLVREPQRVWFRNVFADGKPIRVLFSETSRGIDGRQLLQAPLVGDQVQAVREADRVELDVFGVALRIDGEAMKALSEMLANFGSTETAPR